MPLAQPQLSDDTQRRIAELQRQKDDTIGKLKGNSMTAGMANNAGAEFDRQIGDLQKGSPNENVDFNKFNYGGDPNAANEALGRYRGMAEGAQGRQGAQVDYAKADWNRQDARSAVGLLGDAARGNAPSVAALQQQQGIDQSIQAQQSLANSTRGGALAGASAQRQSMNQAGNMQAQAVNQAAQLRAGEMAQARGAYSGAALQGQAQDAQQAQYQAGLNQQQRSLNDTMTMGMTGMEHQVRMAQGGAGMGGEGLYSTNNLGQQQMDLGRAQLAAQQEEARRRSSDAMLGGLMQAGSQVGMAAAMSDERNKQNVEPLTAPTYRRPAPVFQYAPSKQLSEVAGDYSPIPNQVQLTGPAIGGPSAGTLSAYTSDTAPEPQKPAQAAPAAKKAAEKKGGMLSGMDKDEKKQVVGGLGQAVGSIFGAGAAQTASPQFVQPISLAQSSSPDRYMAYSDVRTKESVGPAGASKPKVNDTKAKELQKFGNDMVAQTNATYAQPVMAGRSPMSAHDAQLQKQGADMEGQYRATFAQPTAVHPVEDMLRKAPAYSYNYKPGVPGTDPTKRAHGPMAQDLEQSEMGRSMVVDTPQGKAIDLKRATTVGMAADSHLQNQIDELKAMNAQPVATAPALARYNAAPPLQLTEPEMYPPRVYRYGGQ